MIDSIIFDLDGTLWNVQKETYKVVNEVLKKHNLKSVSQQTVNSAFGRSSSECAELYMPNENKEYREKVFQETEVENVKYLNKHKGSIFPNLEEVLKKLQTKYKLFIVSNCGEGYIESFLDPHDFNKYFTDFIAACKENISKKEAIKLIIERNTLKNPIYVGDTYGDFESASSAGIQFIHANYGFDSSFNSKYSINRISDLPEYIENNFS